MIDKLRVCLIYHEFPPITSGIGSYTYDLANNLAKKNIKTIVITGNYNREDEIEVVNKNLKVYRLKTPAIMPRFVWFQLKNKKKIEKILREEKINILHGQESSSAFLFSNRVFNGKKIITIHGDAFKIFKETIKAPLSDLKIKDVLIHVLGLPIWYFLERKEIKKSDLVITFNLALQDSIKKTYESDKIVEVIGQGLDLKKINGFRTEKNIKSDNSLFFAGRLIWIKGITYLLESFKEVHEKYPSLKLKMFGEGPLKPYIQEFIKENNLGENIQLYGFVSLERLVKEISRSDIAVLPSLYESFGIVTAEAMACEKPVIATNIDGTRELIENGENGILIEPKNKDELTKSILRLLENRNLRQKLGKSAYKTIKYKRDWNNLVGEYIKTYKKVLNNNHGYKK